MPDVSTFSGVIGFFDRIGVYDVVLPFLLVFTVVFAILEKSKIFGYDEVNGEKFPKKNLNSMVAFVIAFLTIASTKVVAVINEALAHVVLLLIVSISALILVGSLYGQHEDFWTKIKGRGALAVIMLIAVLFIFLHAIKTSTGEPWLIHIWEYLAKYWSTQVVGSIILIGVLALFLWYIVHDTSQGTSNSKEKETKG